MIPNASFLRDFTKDLFQLFIFYFFFLVEITDLYLNIDFGWGRSFLSVAWPTGVQLVFFFCSVVCRLFGAQGSPSSGSLLNLRVLVFDSSGCFIVIYLFVFDDSWTS